VYDTSRFMTEDHGLLNYKMSDAPFNPVVHI
jgi:hypothetical protein